MTDESVKKDDAQKVVQSSQRHALCCQRQSISLQASQTSASDPSVVLEQYRVYRARADVSGVCFYVSPPLS